MAMHVLGNWHTQTWDMDAEFAAGFIYLFFIFGSTMVKIINVFFLPK